MENKINTIHRKRHLTDEEAARYDDIRRRSMRDFPPKKRKKPATKGVAAAIRKARLDRGLSWYALAKKAGIPNQATIRELEYGGDVRLSSVEALVKALDLRIEVTQNAG